MRRALRSPSWLCFDLASRLSKRNFELGVGPTSGNSLLRQEKFEWVPNGRGEQPQRKPAFGEGFRVGADRARSTALRLKMAEFLRFSDATSGPAVAVSEGFVRGGPVRGLQDGLRSGPLAGRQHERRGARDPPKTHPAAHLPQCRPRRTSKPLADTCAASPTMNITSEVGPGLPGPSLGHRSRSAKVRLLYSYARDAP